MTETEEIEPGSMRRATRGCVAYAVFIPVALALVLASATAYFFSFILLGTPTGPLGTAFTLAWFAASLVGLLGTFLWLYRRITGRTFANRPGTDHGDRTPVMGELLRGGAGVAGLGLGVAFVYVDGLLVGDGPLWLAELPLVLGGAGAILVAVRSDSKAIVSAAGGFFAACALFALLFLGAE